MEQIPGRFFDLMFGEAVGDESLLTVWGLPSKATSYHANTATAAQRAIERSAAEDVYFGLGLRRPGASGRGSAEDVVGITALWSDIDIAGAGHVDTRKRLCENESQAIDLIYRLQPTPSMVIRSGGGFHLYWLLTECEEITDATTMERATAASKRWCMSVQKIARDCFGVDVDSTWDLARVLRVPGTFNRKRPGEPFLVAPHLEVTRNWIDDDPVRYDLSTLMEYAIDVDAISRVARISGYTVSADLKVDPNRKVSRDDIHLMCANDPKFKSTWNRQREDLHDQSLSGYDMALAGMAAMAGWDDQQIADLIVEFRRTHGRHQKDWDKATRLSYITRTISKVRETTATQQAEDHILREPAMPTETMTGDRREEIIDHLRKVLHVPLRAWLRHGEENPDFSMVLDDGRDVTIGSSANVDNQKAFRRAVWEAIRIRPPAKKEATWTQIMNLLGAIETVVANPEATRAGKLREWVEDYTANTYVHNGDSWWAGLVHGRGFVLDGELHIAFIDFKKHLKRQLDARVEDRELARMLRVVGAKQREVSRVVEVSSGQSKRVRRMYWALPTSFWSRDGGGAVA